MSRTVLVSLLAQQDLLDIWEYIAADSIDIADRVAREIDAEFQKLAEMPGIGQERDDVTWPRLRFWSIYSYVIAYTYDDQELLVTRVVSGYRDFRQLFKS